mgnify:FL=1
MKILLLLCFTFLVSGCVGGATTIPEQTLELEGKVYSMSRSEVIDAIRECETSGTRAVTVWTKRKINGYPANIIADITCAPKWK